MRSIHHLERILVISSLIWAGMVSSVQAVIVRVDFTAKVDSIYDSANVLGGGITVGKSGSGYFQYNTNRRDRSDEANWGEYGPVTSFRFTLGDLTVIRRGNDREGRLLIVNNQSYFGDTFYWQSLKVRDNKRDFEVTDVGMELRDFESQGADIFASDALPLGFNLNSFDSINRFFYIEFGFQQVINMTVTSLTTKVGRVYTGLTSGSGASYSMDGFYGSDSYSYYSNAVPEPSSFVLFGIAAVMLAGTFGWQRRLRNSPV